MRIMTRDRGADAVPEDDVPSYGGFPAMFLWKLLDRLDRDGIQKARHGAGAHQQIQDLMKLSAPG